MSSTHLRVHYDHFERNKEWCIVWGLLLCVGKAKLENDLNDTSIWISSLHKLTLAETSDTRERDAFVAVRRMIDHSLFTSVLCVIQKSN